ncbi:rabphilin-3A isoform X2 [Zophobas morio]|uniref:rabphilin-3A isoform X2 n=1 Tax=Zophobas morio TaxID=2755281 RepID=UPI003083052A
MVDCGSSETTNRFVCPNDRQLALRAKLKTGWSVKTASLSCHGSSVSQPLGPEEQEAIVNVIKRAEEVDLTEQERVGRLIERLENMRRNALGRNPSQCLLCGDGFGMLGAQKVLCIDCKRLVCQKCAIESCTTKNTSCRNYWLCLICAETREIWKKSGAWFFKSIPKYILPSEKSYRQAGSKIIRNAKAGYRDDDSSSDEDRKVWGKIHRRNSNVHESVQDIPTMSTYNRQTSTSDSQLTKDVEPLKGYMGAMSLAEKSWEKDQVSGESSEASRRESTVSRSLSEWNWSDSRSEEKVSPSTSSVSSIFKTSDDHKHSDTSLGTIELSLTYDPITTTLLCTVYRAKNLIPMDINGLSDPFCKLNILPNAKMSTRLRTKTVHKTRNPEFNENLTFYDITDTDLMKKSLHVLVVDDDKFGHDYMGETRIPLAKLKQQNTIYVTAPLEEMRQEHKGPLPAPELNQWFDDLWSRGQILLSLGYSTKRRALLVTVCRCVNLLPMDNNGFSDPFVKLQLRPDPYHRKHKTSIKWKNLNPVYNEEFAFDTRPNELATQSLYITVYDKDYGKSNDYLGGLILGGTGSKGLRLKQWLDMIRYPDHRHEAWHNLTEEVLD